jgi:hypothetical protein
MNDSMRELKETATAHMSRDMKAKRKWLCTCEACREIRALMGMDKLLGVWPLVRTLERMEEQLEKLPEGEEKQALRAQCEAAYDQLAREMAR